MKRGDKGNDIGGLRNVDHDAVSKNVLCMRVHHTAWNQMKSELFTIYNNLPDAKISNRTQFCGKGLCCSSIIYFFYSFSKQ